MVIGLGHVKIFKIYCCHLRCFCLNACCCLKKDGIILPSIFDKEDLSDWLQTFQFLNYPWISMHLHCMINDRADAKGQHVGYCKFNTVEYSTIVKQVLFASQRPWTDEMVVWALFQACFVVSWSYWNPQQAPQAAPTHSGLCRAKQKFDVFNINNFCKHFRAA